MVTLRSYREDATDSCPRVAQEVGYPELCFIEIYGGALAGVGS